MVVFNLFRIHVVRKEQLALGFDGQRSRPDVLAEIVSDLPRADFSSGGVWHIGNLERLEGRAFYFKIGMTRGRLKEVYRDGLFTEVPDAAANSTHVLLDIDSELLAIGAKQSLGSPSSIAGRFLKLLMLAPKSDELDVNLSADPIRDPELLLNSVESASQITRVWIQLPLKNAFNNKEKLFEPVQDQAKEIRAQIARLEFIGKNIDPTRIQELIKEVADIGGNAGASLRPEVDQKVIYPSLNNEEIKVPVDDVDDTTDKRKLLESIKTNVRGAVS